MPGFFGRKIGDRGSQLVTCGAVLISMALGILLFIEILGLEEPRIIPLATWIRAGGVDIGWALRLDTLSGVMILAVTIVSAMVHVYSIGYMADDPGIPRFMSYLSLFTFFMLMLVTADNFVQLFFGWEGVGLMSYILIGYWYERNSANYAAIKAFVVNRVGDFGFALGIFAVFVIFGSLDFDVVFAKAPAAVGTTINFLGWQVPALGLACVLLFIGAMGKSAQIGLHTWLPDAMEGPTPVSALIHAATMVTAGVFMVVRLSPMFEYAPTALAVVGVIGGTTAIFAASIGMVQNDIKRVIAYSTCSQLGYMFFAAGVSAYTAAMFHLFTHAFFKALLFLGAGSVIHAMSGEQDMRRMGGLWKKIPITYVLMWIGSLSLAGIPFFAGYYSKDSILMAAWASGTAVGRYSFTLGIFAAFMTAFYSVAPADHDIPRRAARRRADDAPCPRKPVGHAAAAVRARRPGRFSPVGCSRASSSARNAPSSGRHSVLVLPAHDSIEAAEHIDGVHRVSAADRRRSRDCYRLSVLFDRARYPDAAVDAVPLALSVPAQQMVLRRTLRPAIRAQRLLARRGAVATGDGKIIDGLGPDGIAAATRELSREASRLQTGYLYHYAFAMLIGVVALVTWYLLPR